MNPPNKADFEVLRTMFWPIKRTPRDQSRASKKLRRKHSRRLFLESLEGRRLLAGVVNITWNAAPPAGFPANTLLIQGDNQANGVVISQNAGAASYSISRPAGETTPTQFMVNGLAVASLPILITPFGPFGDIVVDLGPNSDSFTFNNALQSPGVNSNVFGNLSIKNDGTDTNTITNVTTAGALQIFDDNPANYVPGGGPAALPARPVGVTPLGAASLGSNVTNALTDVIVGTDLVINTNGGSNNTITSTSITPPPSTAPGVAFPAPTMRVNGGLWVTAIMGAAAGQNNLTISNNSLIIGPTIVTNAGGGGSNTTVIDSTLRGSVPANNPPNGIPGIGVPAFPQDGLGTGIGLQIENDFAGAGGGMDVVKIQGRSIIGAGTAPVGGAAPFSQTAIYINNRSGGSMTTFGKARADDMNTVQVLGGLKIANGANVAGVLDVTSIDQTNVSGGTYIYNAGSTGGTSTTVTNSTLGSSLAVSPPGTPSPVGPVLGNPFVLINDAGADAFTSRDANFPWGIYINNDDMGGGATTTFTHMTDIAGGSIGRIGGAPAAAGFLAGPTTLAGVLAEPGLAPAAAGPLATGAVTSTNDALFIGGGGFNDIVNVGVNPPAFGTTRPPAAGTATQIYGDANINLGAGGTNFVTMIGQSTGTTGQPINGISILGGAGVDNVWIQNFAIQANVFIALDGNAPIAGPATLTSPLGTVFGSIDTLNLKTTTTLPGVGGTVFVTGGAAVGGVPVDDLLIDNIVIDAGVASGLVLPPGFFFI